MSNYGYDRDNPYASVSVQVDSGASKILKEWDDSKFNFSQRVDAFKKLSWDDQLMMNGYAPQVGVQGTPLPKTFPVETLHEPQPDKMRMRKEAVNEAIRKVADKFYSRNEDDDDSYDSQADSSDDDDSDEDRFVPCISGYNQQSARSGTSMDSTIVDFLKALEFCHLFDCGFRCFGLVPGDVKHNWCPCGRYMDTWKQSFGLLNYDIVKSAATHCTRDGGKMKEPKGFMDHVRVKGQSCPFHYGVACYVEHLYSTWKGVGHKGLFDVGGQKYKRAVAAEKQEMHEIVLQLVENQKQAEAKALAAEKEKVELEKKYSTLQKVSEDLEQQVKNIRKEKELLGISKRVTTVEKISPGRLAYHRKCFDLLLETEIKSLNENNSPIDKAKEGDKIELHVENNFSVQELFDNIYDRYDQDENMDTEFFFREDFKDKRKKGCRGKDYRVPLFLRTWNVCYGDKYVNPKNNKRKREASKQEVAIDEGGPTRDFLCQVWKQLPSLVAKVEGKQVALFEKDKGAIPTTDEKIQQHNCEELQRKVRLFYTAIGRLMLRSIISKNPISSTAMPVFYRNLIFRACDPKDNESYPRDKMYDDVKKEMGLSLDPSWMECTLGQLNLAEENDPDYDEKLTPETYFTKFLFDQAVTQRDIAIKAIMKGLTLDGRIHIPDQFKYVPEEAVSKIIFAPTEYNAEDVINLIKVHEYVGGKKTQKDQKIFEKHTLREVLKEQAGNDENFLAEFVRFVTGLSYIPDADAWPDFHITVYFEDIDEQSLPSAHTCANALNIPKSVYKNDIELFATKLLESVKQAKDAFSQA